MTHRPARQLETDDARDAVEFDVHGLVGIRLETPSAADATAVERQLGLPRTSLGREPDILIRFVSKVSLRGPVRYLGMREAAFGDGGFVILGSGRGGPRRVRIPFDAIGGRVELECESGISQVPLLVPILNLNALGRGILPLHAAAFMHRGLGVAVTGWAKGGKTETLLGFMAAGATYIGDEWVYVEPSSRRLHGLPEPIRIWEWHLTDLPEYRSMVPATERARWAAIRAGLWGSNVLSRRAFTSLGSKIAPELEQRLFVHRSPVQLFGPERCVGTGSLDRLVFVVSWDAPDVVVEQADPMEIARRMVSSLQYERLRLVASSLKFRFAMPDRVSEVLARAEEVEAELLLRAFSQVPAVTLYHPFPAPIPAMVDVLSAALE